MTTVTAISAGNGSFVHEALLYRDADDYLDETLAFIRGGTDAGEPVLVAVPGPNLRLIEAALGPGRNGVRFADMSEVGRNPGRIIPGVLHAFVDAHPAGRVRIIGEPIWAGRSDVAYPACVQHEALVNVAFARHAVTILCPYDVTALRPDVLADAAATHPVLVDERGRRRSAGYAAPARVVATFNRPLPNPAGTPRNLVFDRDTLPAVRALVADAATRHGLAHERAMDLQIAVNEVATNAAAHGRVPATLRAWPEGAVLICEVTDSGEMTDPMAGRIPPAPNSEGGRGLLLVNNLCDLVRSHTDRRGTTVRMYMGR
ncbi:MAG TPA: sensor histidine kinase [Micromonosporaceae bacterium]|jgi:anti-sigma regulatory factor (Ser/Thr protein kinase)